MALSLDDLVNQSLSQIIQSGGLPTEDALFARQQAAVKPTLYGRGLGISSVMQDALAKARVDATLAAQQAQLSALGQAASISQSNLNRQQQQSQFEANLGQRNKELGQQKSLANQQMLASGLGAGAGAALNVGGMVFAPQIRKGLQSLFGSESTTTPGTTNDMPIKAAGLPSLSDTLDASGGMPDFSSSLPDISVPDLNLDFGSLPTPQYDLGFNGGLDLSGLFDTSAFSPSAYNWSDLYWG